MRTSEVGWQNTDRNLADRELIEQLRRNEQHYRLAAESAGFGIYDADLETQSLYWSPEIWKILGLSPDTPTPRIRDVPNFVHPEDAAEVRAMLGRALDPAGDGYVFNEHRVIRPDGSVRWMQMRGQVQFAGEGKSRRAVRNSGVVFDITERKRIETALRANEESALQALRESEAQFRTLADSLPQLVWSCTREGECDYLSRQWVDYTGAPVEDQLGFGWFQRFHPDDRRLTVSRWREAIATGNRIEIEFRLRGRNGSYRWFMTRAHAHRDMTGKIVKWFGTCTDIEDQKHIEQELRQANSDLEQFAYSASHDLQEPLRNVTVSSQLFRRKFAEKLDEEAHQLLQYMIEGSQRMGQLVSDLLTYTRITQEQDTVPSPVNVERVLQNVLTDLGRAIKESGAVVTHDRLPTILMNDVHLRQVLQNLIGNAIKYRKQSEPARIHISSVKLYRSYRFSVADNGIGIDPQFHSQIFGVFKRLHPKGGKYEGTGIGLAICQKIVERYGGRIWLDSRAGIGTTIHFTVPRSGIEDK
jgi:PAS domain S-box-containing protein